MLARQPTAALSFPDKVLLDKMVEPMIKHPTMRKEIMKRANPVALMSHMKSAIPPQTANLIKEQQTNKGRARATDTLLNEVLHYECWAASLLDALHCEGLNNIAQALYPGYMAPKPRPENGGYPALTSFPPVQGSMQPTEASCNSKVTSESIKVVKRHKTEEQKRAVAEHRFPVVQQKHQQLTVKHQEFSSQKQALSSESSLTSPNTMHIGSSDLPKQFSVSAFAPPNGPRNRNYRFVEERSDLSQFSNKKSILETDRPVAVSDSDCHDAWLTIPKNAIAELSEWGDVPSRQSDGILYSVGFSNYSSAVRPESIYPTSELCFSVSSDCE